MIVNDVARPGTFTTGDTFRITDDGVQNWRVVTAAGRVAGGTVQIDSDGPPRVTLGAPAEDGTPTYPTGTRNVDAICRDTTLVDCTFSIGGVPVANGDPLPTQLGSYVLSYVATDKIGNTTSGNADFVIEAVTATPVITSSTIPVEPQPIADGVTVSASFTDASFPFDEVTATIDWGDDSPLEEIVPAPPTSGQASSFSATRTYAGTGTYPVTITVRDRGGLTASVTGEVVVYDPAAPPVFRGIDAPLGDRLITSPIDIVATFTDESIPVDTFTATIDWGDGTVETADAADIVAPTFAAAGTVTGSHQYTVPGDYTVVVTVEDESGATDDIGAPVSVVAPAGEPVIESIDGPTTPQPITESVLISATFSDTSAPFDTFTATVDWGDGTQSAAQVTDPTGPSEPGAITADHVYSRTGVYPVTITVFDRDGASDSELFEFVVVFDPDTTGRVAGSGTYWSGSEAYAGTSRWGSPAFFGYNARYPDGADVPSGETQLRLLGKFYFRSTSYDYLIVNDAIAIAEGVGRIGTKNYRFRVQGIDNGWLDFFQITIWDPATDEVLYDNGVLYDKGDVVLLGGIKVRGG